MVDYMTPQDVELYIRRYLAEYTPAGEQQLLFSEDWPIDCMWPEVRYEA